MKFLYFILNAALGAIAVERIVNGQPGNTYASNEHN